MSEASVQAARRRFETLARDLREQDLAEAALCIAAEAQPGLDVAASLARLDALAAAAKPVVEADASETSSLERIGAFLREQGFQGNDVDYYDPRNSFLDQVIERRTGIPITLALVHLEVARRLEVPAVGVGFPGHFLLKSRTSPEVVLDPFSGERLSERRCLELLRRALGPEAQLAPDHLAAATPRDFLVRILGNLKQIYVSQRAWESALACCDRSLTVAPESAHGLRDRGLVYRQLECHEAARRDLRRFLELAPGDPSAPEITRLLEGMQEVLH